MRRALTCLGLLLALNQVRANDGWALLKLGMSGSEVAAALGSPLICSKGRGFERWTYDNGAEVLIHGWLIGWTVPGVANVAKRSNDIWQTGNADMLFSVVALQSAPANSGLASTPERGVGSPSGKGVVPRAPLLRGAPSRW
jgi:hypothetical protein